MRLWDIPAPSGDLFNGRYYDLKIIDSDNEVMKIKSRVVINCAGLFSDKIASMAGIDLTVPGTG